MATESTARNARVVPTPNLQMVEDADPKDRLNQIEEGLRDILSEMGVVNSNGDDKSLSVREVASDSDVGKEDLSVKIGKD